MAKHLLNRTQIGAALEQVRGKRMPQRVRGNGFGYSRLLDVLAKNLPRTHARERLTTGIEKQNAFASAFFKSRPELTDIGRNGPDRRSPDGDEPLLASFAEHPHQLFLEQHVAHAERDPFGYAKAGPIRELEHRPIAEGKRLVERRRRDQSRDLVDREDIRQRTPPFR